MAKVHIRKRTYRNGKVSYEYYFEAASVNGERKRISQSGFATKTAARTAGQRALNDYEHIGMTITKVSDISCADFLSQWIDEDVSHTCKEITVENYKKKIRLYINPHLGDKRLKNINKLDIRDFLERQVQWKSDNSRTKNDKLEKNGSNAAGDGFWYLSEPKYQSYRIINLDDEILALLQREKAKREKAEPLHSKI